MAPKLVQPCLRAVIEASSVFGDRLIGTFVIGSLARGRFSPHASDVDVALILDEVRNEDAERVKELQEKIKGSSMPFAERLSVFYGLTELSVSSPLDCDAQGLVTGRFPAYDYTDWLRNGERIDGEDPRTDRHLREPSKLQLITESAEFLASEIVTQRTTDIYVSPANDDGAHYSATPKRGTAWAFSKAVLTPIRLLWTSHTGGVGSVDDAVEWFTTWLQSESKQQDAAAQDMKQLAEVALRVRYEGMRVGAGVEWGTAGAGVEWCTAEALQHKALLPLYCATASRFADQMAGAGSAHRYTALKLQRWHELLQT